MSGEALYTQIYEALDETMCKEVDQTTRKRVALLVLGMIEAENASPSRMAQALHRLGLSQASPESIERRLRRIENDEEITDTLCFHPFARHRLLLSKPKELLLIIDPTTQDDRVFLLTVSIWYRGRALPLAWQAWEANQPLEGDGFWTRVSALLDTIAGLLPPNVPVTWLADRAFGTPAFTDIVTAHGWHYVVRLQGQTRCRDRIGRERQVKELVSTTRRRSKLEGEAFKKRKWRQVSIVVLLGKKHKDPLCLASDLPTGWYLLRLYRRRYTIEAMFRDYKSYGWQWERGQVSDLDHVRRLLVGMALATWLAIGTGAEVADSILQIPSTGRRRTVPWAGKRSLFTLGLHQLKCFISQQNPFRLWRTLTDWTRLNWHTQLYFHHARAFVFA